MFSHNATTINNGTEQYIKVHIILGTIHFTHAQLTPVLRTYSNASIHLITMYTICMCKQVHHSSFPSAEFHSLFTRIS